MTSRLSSRFGSTSLPVPVAAQLRRAADQVPDRLVQGAAQAAQRPGPPSLVPNSESVHGDQGLICPKRPYWIEAIERPDLRYPASCDAYACPICGPRKAQQAAAVITYAMRNADRTRLCTLTLAPEDWTTRRQKMRNLKRLLRDKGYRWEIGWATEKNPKGTGLHVHGIQHGDRVPQALLQETWGAIVDIRAVGKREQDRTAGAYTVKEALRVAGYAVKGATASPEALAEHLALNGGRPAHWSRGFLHGKTKREALTEIRRNLADGEALTWRMVPAWTTTTPAC